MKLFLSISALVTLTAFVLHVKISEEIGNKLSRIEWMAAIAEDDSTSTLRVENEASKELHIVRGASIQVPLIEEWVIDTLHTSNEENIIQLINDRSLNHSSIRVELKQRGEFPETLSLSEYVMRKIVPERENTRDYVQNHGVSTISGISMDEVLLTSVKEFSSKASERSLILAHRLPDNRTVTLVLDVAFPNSYGNFYQVQRYRVDCFEIMNHIVENYPG